MKFIAHEYQTRAINRIIEQPSIYVVMSMGLGKSVVTLTAIDKLKHCNFLINKVLIIAPLNVAKYTWIEEQEKWEHLKHTRLVQVLGVEKKRIDALKIDADAYIINRENVDWLISYYINNKKRWDFDMLVIDEATSFKSASSKKFKQLKKISSLFKRKVLLTGTPIANGYMDLWAQFYLLDEGKRLGKTITEYREKYFYPTLYYGAIPIAYDTREGATEIITDKIKDITLSFDLDKIKMPKKIDTIIYANLDKQEQKKYNEFKKSCIYESEQNITASSAGVLINKLLQIANGSVYDDEKQVVNIHDKKIEVLKYIIDQHKNENIIIFYNYKHDKEKIERHFETREIKTQEDKKAWDDKKIKILIAHPRSFGHGLNLQKGGSIIVWYGITYDLELYEQANARIYRQGQANEIVNIYHILTKNTADIVAYRALKDKNYTQEQFICDIKK